MGFNYLKAKELLQRGSLLFPTKSLGDPDTHLIDTEWMKDLVNFGATQPFILPRLIK